MTPVTPTPKRGFAALKPVTRDEWVAALRSGEYRQGRNRLRNPDGKMCCLGVLCSLAGVPDEVLVGDPPDEGPKYPDHVGAGDLLHALNLDYGQKNRLANLNDSGWSFAEIADEIERLLPAAKGGA